MEKNKDYIYLNKHVLKYLNDISIDFLFIGSKFTNTQDNLVYIKDVDNKESTRFQIKCPSGLYSYSKSDIINRLLDGKYFGFNILYTQNNINKILNELFDHYHQKTIHNISFSDLEDFYDRTCVSGFFLKVARSKVKELFNNYFDKVLNKLKTFDLKPIEKWSVGSYIVPLQDRILHRSSDNELTKGKPYKIIRNSISPYITNDYGDEINFLLSEKEAGVKWFATYQEAAKFSKSLEFEKNKIKSVTISSKSCEEYIFPKASDECVKKASKSNRKLLLL